MKRVLSLLLTIIISFSFCACGNSLIDNDSTSKKNQEPLNAQNFVSRLKDESDGLVYGSWESAKAFYFDEENAKVKLVNISDSSFSVDYDKLESASEESFEVCNDSQLLLAGYYRYNLAYSDPENRFVVFADSEYKEGDPFSYAEPLIFMSKENLKSYAKGLVILLDKYSVDMMDALYPNTMEDSIKLIGDCIVEGKQFLGQ